MVRFKKIFLTVVIFVLLSGSAILNTAVEYKNISAKNEDRAGVLKRIIALERVVERLKQDLNTSVILDIEIRLRVLRQLTKETQSSSGYPADTEIIDTLLRQAKKIIHIAISNKKPFMEETGSYVKGYRLIDGSLIPLAICLPYSYNRNNAYPLIVWLSSHEYSHNEAEFIFSHSFVSRDRLVRSLGKRNFIAVQPYFYADGNYCRNIEEDVLNIINMLEADYNIDRDRIYLAGRSIGGYWTWRIGLHHPDLFAAIASITGSDSLELARNSLHLPQYIIHGEKDELNSVENSRKMYKTLKKLGYKVLYDELSGKGHSGYTDEILSGVFDWFLEHKRVRNPKRIVFSTYLPRYGKAYWVRIDRLTDWGNLGTIWAEMKKDNHIEIRTENLSKFALLLNQDLINIDSLVSIIVDGERVLFRKAPFDKEITLNANLVNRGRIKNWTAQLNPRRAERYFEKAKIGYVPYALTKEGIESTMGNWISNVIRKAVDADVGLINNEGIKAGLKQGNIFVEDVFNANFEDRVYTFKALGKELLSIIDYNVGKELRDRLQVSGIWFVFDRNKPLGERIVVSNINPKKIYKIATEDWLCVNGDRYFGRRIEYADTGISVIKAQIDYIKRHKEVIAKIEGRIRSVK